VNPITTGVEKQTAPVLVYFDILEVCKESEDFKEGFSFLLEKRQPLFNGR
jgi:hypothetical protein